MSEKSARIKKLVLLAMFTAIAAVLITLVHFPLFPSAAFLQYDPADVPILIAAFAFGPVAGLIVTVLASFIQAFFLGGDGIYGFLMHVIATGILVMVASTIYRIKVNRKPVRAHAMDGAAFPHTIKVKYTIDGKEYICRKWIGAGNKIPDKGTTIKVTYCEDNPSKARIEL